MKKAILIAILMLTSCGQLTQQDVQTGVEVAQTLLEFVDGLLSKAAMARSNCDRYTTEDTEIRDRAIFECAEINDAVAYLVDMRELYIADKSEENRAALRQAAHGLEDVLEDSGVAK